jgi:transcriptional regulator with XRE-family HTH domain
MPIATKPRRFKPTPDQLQKRRRHAGEYIRALRAKRGLTPQEFADAIGFSRSQLGQWEQGVCFPSGEALIAMQELYDASADYLLGATVSERLPEVSERRAKVSERLSDRMQVGALAEALVGHVIEEYSRNRTHLDPVINNALANLLVGTAWPSECPMPADVRSFDLRSNDPRLKYRMIVPNPQHFLNAVSKWVVILATYMGSVARIEDPHVRAFYDGITRQFRSVLPMVAAEDKRIEKILEETQARFEKLDRGGQKRRRRRT